MYQEDRVQLPCVRKPVSTNRSLTIVKRGKKKALLPVKDLSLVVLVNGCLYVVLEDGQGLRAGDILSRNLDQTKQNGLDQTQPAQQLFYRYESLYDARRGIGRIRGRYDRVERPEVAEWEREARDLLEASWDLHPVSEEKDSNFTLVATQRIQKHTRDRAALKVDARQKFAQAATLLDSTGRRNTGAIPLRMVAVERLLTQRLINGALIGRRMDWRHVVLETYLNELLKECRLIRTGAKDVLDSNTLKEGKDRTPRALKTRADRMKSYASALRTIRVRPFYRVFTRVANELEQAAGLLVQAAETHTIESIEQAKQLMIRVYESMILAEQHWWIQELLMSVARHRSTKTPFSTSQAREGCKELKKILAGLNQTCLYTGRSFGESLENNLVPFVKKHLEAALEAWTKDTFACCGDQYETVSLRFLHECLKEACRPL